MEKCHNSEVLSYFDNTFEILFSLESIIKLTQAACLEKELFSKYYNLASKEKSSLSEERNHYINMLTLALDKVTSLKEINLKFEKNLIKLK